MLEVENLHVSYGPMVVLRDISLQAKEREITAILGSNGAGKSTLLYTIAGILKPIKGAIFYKKEDVTGYPPNKRIEKGITLLPEGGRLFPNLSVIENLKAGACIARAQKRIADNLERIFNMFPILKERKNQLAKTLSGGEQRMLAIARALMSEPSLLMLDEPLTGLQPSYASKVIDKIQELRDNEGVSILLVEQNLHQTLKIMDVGYVIENGRIVLKGSAEEIKTNPHVRRAYLGL